MQAKAVRGISVNGQLATLNAYLTALQAADAADEKVARLMAERRGAAAWASDELLAKLDKQIASGQRRLLTACAERDRLRRASGMDDLKASKLIPIA